MGPEAEYLELFLGYKHNYRNRKVCNKKMEIIESITLATGEMLCGRQLAVCCGPSVGDRSALGRFYHKRCLTAQNPLEPYAMTAYDSLNTFV